jgi:mRNA interferase RelE/StbE
LGWTGLVTEYRVVFMPQATDDLCCLDKPVARRILYKLKWLAQNFDELVPNRLAGELKGFYKLRVGTYRVIYTANEEERLLLVHLVGHRRDIYKR